MAAARPPRRCAGGSLGPSMRVAPSALRTLSVPAVHPPPRALVAAAEPERRRVVGPEGWIVRRRARAEPPPSSVDERRTGAARARRTSGLISAPTRPGVPARERGRCGARWLERLDAQPPRAPRVRSGASACAPSRRRPGPGLGRRATSPSEVGVAAAAAAPVLAQEADDRRREERGGRQRRGSWVRRLRAKITCVSAAVRRCARPSRPAPPAEAHVQLGEGERHEVRRSCRRRSRRRGPTFIAAAVEGPHERLERTRRTRSTSAPRGTLAPRALRDAPAAGCAARATSRARADGALLAAAVVD